MGEDVTPDLYISKFDTVKILSNLFGYSDEQEIDEEDLFYDIVLKYSSNYKKWNSSYNNQIAFLLKNEILTENDLHSFIVFDKDNNEQTRALTREELSLWFARLIGKEDYTENDFEQIFIDEEDILKENINACYYMDSIGVIEKYPDGKFYSKNAVSRGDFAVFIDKFLDNTDLEVDYNNFIKQIDFEDTDMTNTYSRFVNIEKVFLDENKIQTEIEHESKIYQLDEDVAITIDNKFSALKDVEENNIAEIFIKDNIIYKINIDSNLQIRYLEDESSSKFYGTIKNISEDTIGFLYNVIDEDNLSVSEKIDIMPLSQDYKVTRNGVSINSIEEDSLATVILNNGFVTQIILEDINSIFIGCIVEKEKDKITIKTTDDKIFQLILTEDTEIFRNSEKASLSAIRLGDSITLT